MTAHDHPEYVPGCYRCDLSRDEVTAADRPSVTDDARAEAWDKGYLTGYQDRRKERDYDPGQNPYRAAGRAETTTATTEDAVGELLERMSNAVTRLEALRAEHWDASERQRLHGKTEGVKLAASYVEEARGLLATARTRPTREQIITALDHEGAFCGVCGREPGDPLDDCDDCRRCLHRYADAVLALYVDRPTEAETTTGAIARGEALAAGDPDWMNVTRWPRAETTTDIAEDALDSLPYFTFEDDDVAPDEEFVRKADVARLLATARTRPTRDDLARAIASGYEPDHPTPNRHDYRAADAVLALLRGGA